MKVSFSTFDIVCDEIIFVLLPAPQLDLIVAKYYKEAKFEMFATLGHLRLVLDSQVGYKMFDNRQSLVEKVNNVVVYLRNKKHNEARVWNEGKN